MHCESVVQLAPVVPPLEPDRPVLEAATDPDVAEVLPLDARLPPLEDPAVEDRPEVEAPVLALLALVVPEAVSEDERLPVVERADDFPLEIPVEELREPLALLRAVLELLEPEVWVDPTVTCPVLPVELAAETDPDVPEETPPVAEAPLELVIDDGPVLAEALVDELLAALLEVTELTLAALEEPAMVEARAACCLALELEYSRLQPPSTTNPIMEARMRIRSAR